MAETRNLNAARHLMEDFSKRTGLAGSHGKESVRYLWTDAFAVQAFFGLSRLTGEELYKKQALKLIDLVHYHLGRFHPDDPRRGWISGLSEEQGKKHPTAGGLRIGKKLPERKEEQRYDAQLEWERDGQYFHYLTRWVTALLQAGRETLDSRYNEWAADLMQAGGEFITRDAGHPHMYWKMSTDLSRPLVPSMGAHDPLEGLTCTLSVEKANPEKKLELEPLSRRFEELCKGMDWKTSDSLGIGGLLLNTLRAAALAGSGMALPGPVKAEKLFRDSMISLESFYQDYPEHQPAGRRLAFRECGLSLGIRALDGMTGHPALPAIDFKDLKKYHFIADGIEEFWMEPGHQTVPSWTQHLDINTVSLASSLIATMDPGAFSAMSRPG